MSVSRFKRIAPSLFESSRLEETLIPPSISFTDRSVIAEAPVGADDEKDQIDEQI
jgi:hypothetical protein